MTAQRPDRPRPHIERSFSAVRAALPAESTGAFDAQLGEIAQADVVDLAAPDSFLSAWHRIATRAAADPEDWRLMHEEAAASMSGDRPLGPTLAEVLASRVPAP